MDHYPDCPEPTATPKLTRRDNATREECPACGQVTWSDDWPDWETDPSYQAMQDEANLLQSIRYRYPQAVERIDAAMRAKRLDVDQYGKN